MPDQNWYEKNKVRAAERARQYAQTEKGKAAAARASANYRRRVVARIKAEIDAIKSRPCMDCKGTFDPVCMDFDHRPGEEKRFSVAEWRNWKKQTSMKGIMDEIAKCDIVCSNCHRLRTVRRLREKNEVTVKQENEAQQLDLLGSIQEEAA
jgi:DNA-binding MarR family transcriptional regulator